MDNALTQQNNAEEYPSFHNNYEQNYPYDLKNVVKDVSDVLDFEKFEFNDQTLMLQGKYAGQTAKEVMEKNFQYLIWADRETMQRLSPEYIQKYIEMMGHKMNHKTREMYLEKAKWQVFCREHYDRVKMDIFLHRKYKHGDNNYILCKNQRNLHDQTILVLKEIHTNQRAEEMNMRPAMIEAVEELKDLYIRKGKMTKKKNLNVQIIEDLSTKEIIMTITEAIRGNKSRITKIRVSSVVY